MKICILHFSMGLTNRGSEISTDLIATELSKKHEVLLLQSGEIKSKPYRVERVYRLDKAPATSPTTIAQKILFRLHLDEESGVVAEFTKAAIPVVAKFDPDIIIAVNGSLQVKILKNQNLRSHIVVFGRAGIGYHDRDTLASGPDLFIALSDEARVWAEHHAPGSTKVVYIPNPVGVTKAKKIKLDLPHPVVLVVSALSKYKNIDKVIDAVRLTNASLLLIGDGEESESISRKLSTLVNNFRWIKYLEPDELSSYYASSDIFCFVPGPQEAFGRVYLEAMAAGLPIIASDDPIRRSIIGGDGNYVVPSDVERIAGLITQNAQSGKLDYSSSLKKYELTAVVKQIEKEINELI